MVDILKNPTIAPLIKQARRRVYAKGQTILYPNSQSADLYVIEDGAVSVHDIDDHGNRKVMHIFGPPALFPLVSFTAELAASAWFYTALIDTRVYVLSYREFKDRLEEIDSSSAYNLLLKQLLDEVHELLVHITNSTRSSSSTRLVAALKFLAAHHAKVRSTNWRPISFPVPHQLLADMTGLTRETVSVTIKRLQQHKLVRYPAAGRLEINNARLFKY